MEENWNASLIVRFIHVYMKIEAKNPINRPNYTLAHIISGLKQYKYWLLLNIRNDNRCNEIKNIDTDKAYSFISE